MAEGDGEGVDFGREEGAQYPAGEDDEVAWKRVVQRSCESVSIVFSSFLDRTTERSEHSLSVLLFQVDIVALNIPDYPKVIQSPRSLSTIKKNLSSNASYTSDLFERDMQLVVDNARLFNGAESIVGQAATALERHWRSLDPAHGGGGEGARKRKESGEGGEGGEGGGSSSTKKAKY